MKENFSCSKQLSNVLKKPNKKSEVLSQLLFGEEFIKLKTYKSFIMDIVLLINIMDMFAKIILKNK